MTTEELLHRAVSRVYPIPRKQGYGQPRWSAFMQLFAVGSTQAREICIQLGLNPEEKVSRKLM